MYLKNIEVQGFKSFAQKINFEFHNGITGIVGPNGSGKSNVADAVRWVLGEQSAKQLRGGNMQDVIFSGTENRKPLSFAYVAITLDNSDHRLPIDYNEVTVARRLYRSGESEYLLNGSNCRLKEINELFYDTGIGKEGYSIIGQGQIDKILSGKPEDRRELFDEAAGIVKFKRRKNTTMKKLEQEQQNLLRVTDILGELTRQLGPLEKQSEKAKQYLQMKEEQKSLDVNLFLLELSHIDSQQKEIGGKQEIARRNLEDLQNAFEATREEYQKLEEELAALDGEIEASRSRAQEAALRRQQLEAQIELLQEQIRAGRQSDAHFRSRMEVLEAEVAQKNTELEDCRRDRARLHEKSSAIGERQTGIERELSSLREHIETASRAVEDGKNEIIELLNARATTKGRIQRFDAMMEQIEIRRAELAQRTLRLKSEESDHERLMADARQTYSRVTDTIAGLEQEQKTLEQQVSSLQEMIKKQTEQLDIGQVAYHREASRLESLKNIAERYDGYGNSIRRVMERKKNFSGIHGVVADLIHVDREYEVAIETALGAGIQNIVTDNEETARDLIRYLKKNRYGRATFLPLTSIRRRGEFGPREALREPGVVGIASELVHVDKTYRELIDYLLGRTLVVDQIDNAIAIGRKYKHSFRMVTIEGESINPGGSMTGGAYKNSSNLLGRRREIEELEESVGFLKSDMDKLQGEIGENRSRRNALREEIASLAEKIQQQYIEQNTAALQIAQLEEKQSEMKSGYDSIEQEQREILRQTEELTKSTEEIRGELARSQQDERELEDFICTKQEELDEYQSKAEVCAGRLEAVHLEFAETAQQEDFRRQNIERIEAELRLSGEELAGIRRNLEDQSGEITRRESEIEEIKRTLEAAGESVESEEQALRERLARREEINAAHKSFFDRRDELSAQISLLDKECFRLQSQMERLEETQESQINYMWEEYEITPANAQSYRMEEPGSRAAMKKELGRIREEIRGLGDVNVNAIEDYKNLLERHTFLSAQYEDLVKAEGTLKNIIAELDAGMRRQFAEEFANIRKEFDRAFRELFGGGKGTLELTEEDDILDAGIRIIAQPPGKKLQNMMQLSGGEKALTAIALLFAIQNLKPSPFCLLDEIEAALDDSNVVRYAEYLQKLTENTQFIIITHRRGTMNAADRLYGITMQEKGVSTLVSVDLVEHELDK